MNKLGIASVLSQANKKDEQNRGNLSLPKYQGIEQSMQEEDNSKQLIVEDINHM